MWTGRGSAVAAYHVNVNTLSGTQHFAPGKSMPIKNFEPEGRRSLRILKYLVLNAIGVGAPAR